MYLPNKSYLTNTHASGNLNSRYDRVKLNDCNIISSFYKWKKYGVNRWGKLNLSIDIREFIQLGNIVVSGIIFTQPLTIESNLPQTIELTLAEMNLPRKLKINLAMKYIFFLYRCRKSISFYCFILLFGCAANLFGCLVMQGTITRRNFSSFAPSLIYLFIKTRRYITMRQNGDSISRLESLRLHYLPFFFLIRKKYTVKRKVGDMLLDFPPICSAKNQ